MSERDHGCVTNFPRESPKYTIWRSGDYYRAEEFGLGGKLLSIQGDPVFQDLAREVYRLACEVGRLRRVEIDAKHGIAPAVAEKILVTGAETAKAATADWLERQAAAHEQAARRAAPQGIERTCDEAVAGAFREAALAVRQGRARPEGGS
jgi:hypothetical protein